MNKTIRLNKRTLLTFLVPHFNFNKTYNRISLSGDTNFLIQYYKYYKYYHNDFKKNKLSRFYNIDFELCLLGFGISIETIVNKNKVDNIVSSSKVYFAKLKQLTTKKSHES